MRKLPLIGIALLAFLNGCTSDRVAYAPSEDSVRVASVGVYGYQPSLADSNYLGAVDNWYAGTPNYYSPASFAAWN